MTPIESTFKLSACRARWLTPAIVLAASLTFTAAPASAQLTGTFDGYALALRASADILSLPLDLGRVSGIRMQCQGTNGQVRRRNFANINVPGLVSVAAGFSTIFSEKTSNRAKIRNQSRLLNVNLLGGTITADAIHAVANVRAAPSKTIRNANGSTFVNLVVLGSPIVVDPDPNTVIPLPGIGTVTLNLVDKAPSGIRVEMLRIDVLTANGLGLPVGASISVGTAKAVFRRGATLDRFVGGRADILLGKVGELRLGLPAAALRIPCQGTDGDTLSKEVVTLDVPGVLTGGVASTTAFAGNTVNGIVAKTTATVADISLFNGLISVGAITAVARDTYVNGVRTSSAAGSLVQGLTVAGLLPFPDISTPNFGVTVPLIGTLILNEQVIPDPLSANFTRSTGLRLSVELPNLLGIPVGTSVIIARATSMVDGRPGMTATVASSNRAAQYPPPEESEDWDSF